MVQNRRKNPSNSSNNNKKHVENDQRQQQQNNDDNNSKTDMSMNRNLTVISKYSIIKRKIFISILLMTIIYGYHSYFKKTNNSINQNELLMASINDNYQGSPIGQYIDCINDDDDDDDDSKVQKKSKFPKCISQKCGRFVGDSIVDPNETLELRLFVQKLFSLIHTNGGVAIFDLSSGALSNGSDFLNAYKLLKYNSKIKKIFSESKILEKFNTIQQKLIQTLSLLFGIDYASIYLTSPVFFTRINSKQSRTMNDEYWHRHIDKYTYENFHYTTLLYLSTFNDEFRGGRFIFNDNALNITVQPKFNRVLMFTSGSENPHQVEPVESGERYAITIPFTCDQQKRVKIPLKI